MAIGKSIYDGRRRNKRVSKRALDYFNSKRVDATRTFNCYRKMQCCSALKNLMAHKDAWPFKKANLKESKPGLIGFDFETVMWKLEKGMYTETLRFADDVRAVFGKAKLLYSPRHEVHRIALRLSALFEKEWRALEEKWEAEGENKPKLPFGIARKKRKLSIVCDDNFDADSGMLQSKKEEKGEAAYSKNSVFWNVVELQRKKERERLEKMERTVFFDDDSLKTYQEFEELCGGKGKNSLEGLLGLVLKEEFVTSS